MSLVVNLEESIIIIRNEHIGGTLKVDMFVWTEVQTVNDTIVWSREMSGR